jgi:hypothetical protein
MKQMIVPSFEKKFTGFYGSAEDRQGINSLELL